MIEGGRLQITVRLYSILRHRAGGITNRLDLELPAGSRAGDVLALLEVAETLEVVLALNNKVIAADALLQDGDQLAIIPAISGG